MGTARAKAGRCDRHHVCPGSHIAQDRRSMKFEAERGERGGWGGRWGWVMGGQETIHDLLVQASHFMTTGDMSQTWTMTCLRSHGEAGLMEPGLQPQSPAALVGREGRGEEEWQLSDHYSSLLPGVLASAPALPPPLCLCLLSAYQPEGSYRTGVGGGLLLCSKPFHSSHLTGGTESPQSSLHLAV